MVSWLGSMKNAVRQSLRKTTYGEILHPNTKLVSQLMRTILIASILMIAAGCAHTAGYEGDSAAERKLRAESRRDVYPDDVRSDLDRYRKATLAWPGIVKNLQPDTADPLMATMVIEHHYWDWMEDHSINLRLHRDTGAKTPWRGSLYAAIAVAIGLALSVMR